MKKSNFQRLRFTKHNQQLWKKKHPPKKFYLPSHLITPFCGLKDPLQSDCCCCNNIKRFENSFKECCRIVIFDEL